MSMNDIASLGLVVDSSSVRQGRAEMDQFVTSASRMKQATGDLRSASTVSAREQAALTQAVLASTRATQANAQAAVTQAAAQKAAALAALQETQATQAAVQRKRDLETSIRAVVTASNTLALSRGREKQLQEYAIRLDQQESQNLRALTEAQNAYNQALVRYGSAAATARQVQQSVSSQNAAAYQNTINTRLGVTSSGGLTQADLEENARAADQLRMKYNSLYAAQQNYRKAEAEINAAAAQGILNAEEQRNALAQLATQYNVTGNTAKRSAGQVGSSLTNLSFQLNDIASGLLMGQSPFQIMAQQGGQVFQIWQMNKNIFSDVGAVLTRLLSPTTLVVGAMVAMAAAIAAVYSSAISKQKELEAALVGPGRAAGVTAGQLDNMATVAANASGLTVGSARKIAEGFASSGRVTTSAIGELTAIVSDYAFTTGQKADEASKELTSAFSDLSTGVDTLSKRLGAISPAQREYIKNLEASGQHNAAVKATIDAMEPALSSHEQHLTLIGRLYETIAKNASAAMAAAGAAANPSTEQMLQNAKDKLARDRANRNPIGTPYGSIMPGDINADQQEVNNLTYKLRMERAGANARANAQNSLALANNAQPLMESVTPGYADKQTLTNQVKTLKQLQNDPEALAQTTMSYSQATAALDAYSHALDTYITPAQRANEQASINAQALRAITPAQKAAVAAAQTALDQKGQVINADQRSAVASAAYKEALDAANHTLYIQNETQKMTADGAVALAGAWLQGSNAATRATASTASHIKALTQATNVEKEVNQAAVSAAAAQVAASAQALDTQERQTTAMHEANDAVAEGVISYTQAAAVGQRRAEIMALENLKTDEAVKANKQLIASINELINRKKVANENDDREKDRATYAAITQDLKDQVKLAGLSVDEREKEAAVLQLIRSSVGEVSQAEQDSVRGLVEQRQEAERLRGVVDDVTGAFQDMFTDVFSQGKLSFGKLVDSIKQSFVRLLAYMAAQALVQPVIIPMVGEIMGSLGLGSYGGGVGSLGGGGGSGVMGLLSAGGNISSLGSSLGLFGGGGAGLGSFGLGGIGNAISGAGKFLFGAPDTILAGGETLGGVNATGATGLFGSAGLGAVLGGFGAGSLASSLIFGNKNDAGIGGMSGAAAGAILGSVVPGIGTLIGGLAGGLLGGGLGSMTGSSNQGAIANFNADGTNYLFKQGGGQNGAMATQAANTITQVIQGLASKGVNVSLGNISGLSIGSDKSYVYGYNGMKEKLAGGEQGISAVVSSVLSKILPGATGGDANTQAILSKYQQNGGVTQDNLQQLLSDLDFAKSLANFDFGVKSLTQSQQLLKNISDQFEGAIQKAQQLGLDTTQLVAARDSAIQKVVSDYNDSIAMSLEQITDPVKYAFDSLKKAQEQRIEDAAGLGADLSQVYALNKAEMDALVKQYTQATDATDAAAASANGLAKAYESVAEAQSALSAAYNKEAGALNSTITSFSALSKSLRTFNEGLAISSALNPNQTYAAASSQFDSLAARARGGDLEAAGQLSNVGQQLVTAAQASSVDNVQYQMTLARVRNTISDVADSADQQVSTAQAQLDALNAQVAGLGVIDKDVKTVTQAILDLRAAQARDNATALAASQADSSVVAAANAAAYDAAAAAAANNARVQSLAASAGTTAPHFASGGSHSGGWRVVGEQGPELEYTGPSQIFNHEDSLFDSGSIVGEVRDLKNVVQQLLDVVNRSTGYGKRIKELFEAITSKNGGISVTTNT